MWATRIIHESQLYLDQQGSSFVTLTYRDPSECDDEQYKNGHYIPDDYSLRPSDVKKFMFKLRKRESQLAKKENRPTDIKRYFYCGEYGDENQRPHYHICLFNHSFPDQVLFRDNEGHYTYTSESLADLWPHGFHTISKLDFTNAAYTARYALKKITGKKAEEHYLRCDEHGEAYWLLPEYIRMSTGRNKPCGLGAQFYEKFQTDIFPADDCPIPGKGVIKKVPRYYQNILEHRDPKTLELVKQLRQVFIKAHRNDYTPQRLKDRYICQKAKLTKRNL